MEHLDVLIYGRVQGVSFRFSIKRKAKKLGLFGWVENRQDGSVYIEVEGNKNDLMNILDWCHRGPFFAKVDKVNYEFRFELKGFKNFEIKYNFKK
ncbi:acylphosphatase [bacterium]|nr:acylphosphatase [bacterium]